MVDFCVPFEKVSLDDVPRVGGKTASLGEMVRELAPAGIRVPDGFAITADAYDAVLAQEDLKGRLSRLLEGLDVHDNADLARRGSQARQLIVGVGLPDDVQRAVTQEYGRLIEKEGAGISVAVRSSATAEDLPNASFAGQQATHLNVQGEVALLRAVSDCFASVFTDRAISYREHHGFDHFVVRGAIAVQRMVRADRGSAGVIFTIDPDSGHRNVVLVTGAWGLGESVVAGQVDPDEVWLFKPSLAEAREPIVRRKIGRKQTRIIYGRRGGATTVTVPVSLADQQRRCFTDEDAVQLGRWAVTIEAHYSKRHDRPTPMDIEWVKDGETGELFIVQARPETVQSRADDATLTRFALETKEQPVLTGVAIGSSIGAGKVRVIHSVEDIPQFQNGEVLVTEMTDPDWVPALRRASAVVTDRGGRTCHAAIVSRELGVPCVVGTGRATELLENETEVTVSCARGTQGEIFAGAVPFQKSTVRLDKMPATRTKLMAILADPDQAMGHARLPVAGVGLVRQEFVAAEHIGLHPMAALHPERVSEEVRAQIDALTVGFASPAEFFETRLAEGIAMIAAAFHPRPVIVRLSDFKTNEYRKLLGGQGFEPLEENPMIGLRGASRYIHPWFEEAFALECKALLRVRKDMGLRNVDLMVPFCRTPGEGRQVVERMAQHGLRRGDDGLKIWVMCEIPSNVAVIDRFSEIFDGFSIGSNDLTQLVLGVDRDSELLAATFDESEEAVTRTIATAIKGAHEAGRPIGLCGQAPSDRPEFARFLVEHGIDSISLNPDAVLRAWEVVADAEANLGRHE